MKNIISSQKVFFNSNATKNSNYRINQLEKLKKLILENQDSLDKAIYDDFKKSSFENYTNEISIIIKDIDFALKRIHKWSRKRKAKTNIINIPSKSYIIPEPLGNTLIIGAWNYPYQLCLSPAVAAIAAGNTVILKPSELSPSTSKILSEIINSNFDSNFFHVVEGGVSETTELLSCDFDKIFFTGSETVGKIVYQAAAEKLIPVTLELGGKSPAIITKDCNIKMAAKRLIWAKFLNAGQTCIAPDYILIEEAIKQSFLEQCIIEIEKANYHFKNENYPCIINKKNTERLIGMITPENIYYGGNYSIKDRYISPTILHNITIDHPSMTQEIFGPILPILTYTQIEEAITFIKSKEKPLSCYIFTNDKSVKKKITQEVSFGNGAINEAVMQITNPHLPFGGIGKSGIGNYHGEYGFNTFSHFKSILEKPNWIELNLKYPPYSLKKLKFIKFLLRL